MTHSLITNVRILYQLGAIGHRSGNAFVLICLTEHLGDIVACEPIARHLRHEHPQAHIYWLTRPEYQHLLNEHPDINGSLAITCLSEWHLLRRLLRRHYCVDLHFHGRRCSWFGICYDNQNVHGINAENYYAQQRSLLEAFCLSGGLPRLTIRPVLHFYRPPAPPSWAATFSRAAIVIHAESNEACRNWGGEKFTDLVRQLLEHTDLDCIEIGLCSQIAIADSRFHDRCSALTLQECSHLIARARLFIGIDSSFAHFAHALATPRIILLGSYRNFTVYSPYPETRLPEPAWQLHAEGPVANLPLQPVLNAALAILGP